MNVEMNCQMELLWSHRPLILIVPSIFQKIQLHLHMQTSSSDHANEQPQIQTPMVYLFVH